MDFSPKWFLAASLAFTLSAIPARAGCLTPPASVEELDSFKNDPGGLLKRYPLGSGSLASAIRVLAATDGGVLGAIVGLVKEASDAQKSAIAAGMAQATLACRTQDPALALQIQEAMAGIDNAAVLSQFAAITGDTQTGATGGGAGGGGGGGGSGGASGEGGQTGGSNSGTNGSVGGATTTNGPSAFSVSAAAAGQTGTTTQTLGAAASVVSPSQ